ncbi:YchJ family metal-binding protein [Actinoallomurus spadix]|uniref:YchJ family metal-binding protein n=2 Tax=Actinoallomurus spadix TaxID=79912 RepID=A0ABP3G784_9ACTN
MAGMTQDGPDATSCHCGLPAPYDDCCGRYHRGDAKAPTAERLMRSRYSAFRVGDEAYLLRTWHPSTRPPHIDFDETLRWERLEVLGTTGGGYLDTEGTVHFRAHYVVRNRPGHMEENSRFVLQEGAWLYVGPLTLLPRIGS